MTAVSVRRPRSDVEIAQARAKIVTTIQNLPLKHWIRYPLADLEEAFPPTKINRLSRRRVELYQTTEDKIDTLAARNGMEVYVDPITECRTFARKVVRCSQCNGFGLFPAMVNDDAHWSPMQPGDAISTVEIQNLSCIMCKGTGRLPHPGDPAAIYSGGMLVPNPA